MWQPRRRRRSPARPRRPPHRLRATASSSSTVTASSSAPYFALREVQPFSVKKTGEETTAVYGFVNTLLRVVRELKPTHIAIAMDTAAPTFRHDADADYKAHREPIPEALPAQIERCRQVIQAFGIPLYEADGFEADDVLATIADQAAEAGLETWIGTLDSDLLQLVRPGIKVYMYRPYQRDTVLYDSDEKVRDRYGIDPIQIIDYKALKGDTSDNIPGVPGIGDKTAVKLLNEYRTVDEIYEHLDDVKPPRAQKALREYADLARHSRDMATIRHDVPVSLDVEAARLSDFDEAPVVELFTELEFRSLIDRLADWPAGSRSPAPDDDIAVDYEIVRDASSLARWVDRARAADLVGLNVETSGPDAMDCEIAGYALAVAPGEACYVPVRHSPPPAEGTQTTLDIPDDAGAGSMLPPEQARDALRPLLEDGDVPKLLHNAKFAMKVLAENGVTLRGATQDTMLAAYLLGESTTSLKTLAFERLGMKLAPLQDLIGSGKKQITLTEVPADEAGAYAARTPTPPSAWPPPFADEFERETGIADLYGSMELPLVAVLAAMERTGVTLDPTAFAQLAEQLESEIAAIEQAIHSSVGHEFNVASPKQLSEVFFEELDLPKTRKTTQGYSTDAQALQRIADAHPAIEQVLQYRELAKLKSTYIDTLPGLINPRTGRIHTDYNQAVAATGRLSSENPNLQNIPVAPRWAAPSAPLSSPAPARTPSSSAPTTPRSSCACSPTSPRTPV